MENWPNFFIVGDARAGTTSLYEYLKKIPEIYLSPEKEPHYFAQDSIDFKINPGKIRITDEKKYLALFGNVNKEIAVGEASTTYLRNPNTPKRIFNEIPDAKIIISLRDPVEQFISSYFFTIKKGWNNLSLQEAIEKRCSKPNKLLQRKNGLFEQVNRYLKTFGKENVKVIFFEEFIRKPKKTIGEIIEFLNITNTGINFEAKIYNSVKKDYPILSKKNKENLVEFFQDDVSKLKVILDRDVPWINFKKIT